MTRGRRDEDKEDDNIDKTINMEESAGSIQETRPREEEEEVKAAEFEKGEGGRERRRSATEEEKARSEEERGVETRGEQYFDMSGKG